MRNAFLAGTLIALACGLVGYFLVLRAQVFTSDALGHVAFTAALGALAFGLDPRLGLFAGTILVALAMAALGRRASADDVVIGSTFAWVLGLGVLFLTLYTTQRSTANGVASVNYLFGSIFGLSATQAVSAALVGAAICVAVLAIARPLLFASLDEAVAAAAGVPVRLLGVVFLVLVAATTAEATQAVGALLVLGLVAAPAGAAQQLTARPYVALGLSVGVLAWGDVGRPHGQATWRPACRRASPSSAWPPAPTWRRCCGPGRDEVARRVRPRGRASRPPGKLAADDRLHHHQHRPGDRATSVPSPCAGIR